MAVGNQVTMGGLNSQLGSNAVELRNVCADINKLWSYIVSIGANQAAQIAALQALGFTAGDASSFWTMANNMFAVAQVYNGNQAQAQFNFDNAIAGARGGN